MSIIFLKHIRSAEIDLDRNITNPRLIKKNQMAFLIC